MRSKAPLALMEQAVMVLVFALAAALCLRVFVWSDGTSKRGIERDRAVIEVQNAAEVIKNVGAKGGDTESVLNAAAEKLGAAVIEWDGDAAPLALYDEDWNHVESGEAAVYILRAEPVESGVPGLGRAHISLEKQGGDGAVFELDAAWQTGAAE